MSLPNDILLIIIDFFSDEIITEVLKNFERSNQTFSNIFSNEQQYWEKKIKNLGCRNFSHIDIPLGFFYLKQKKSICYECTKKTVRKFNFNDILLCKKCENNSLNNSDKYRQISKTDAKEQFYLNDDDLKKIQSKIIKNPIYGYTGFMTLYLYTDVIQLVNEKYDNFEEYKIEKEKILNKKRTKRLENKRLRSEIRKSELINELNKYRLQLRNDSKLCDNYINIKKKNINLQQVVHEMCIMKFLYDYTNYEERRNNYIDEYAYHNGWVDMVECSNDVKEEIRQEINGWPNHWPWLKDEYKISENFPFLRYSIDNQLKLINVWKRYKTHGDLKQKEFYNKLLLEFEIIYKKSTRYLTNVEFN